MKQQPGGPDGGHGAEAAAASGGQKTGRGLLDVLLVALCVSLLMALGVMLRPQRAPAAAPAWAPATAPATTPAAPAVAATVAADADAVPAEDGPRERLMSLGFALLLVSLAVCMYAMYRLGFCCNRREYNRGRLRRGLPSVNSRLHLITGTDLPPPYGAVVDLQDLQDMQQPPPYFAIIAFQEEKPPPAAAAAPPAYGRMGQGAATAGSAASRPQEAG